MDLASGLLTAFGLAASAGLNAYIPLLIVALLGRFTTWFTLNSPWDALTSWWVIGALLVLTLIEFFADKAPAINHANDVIQTFVRPAAGAILFAASAGAVSNINPIVAMIAGLLVAGGVHTVKAAAVRPAVTAHDRRLGEHPGQHGRGRRGSLHLDRRHRRAGSHRRHRHRDHFAVRLVAVASSQRRSARFHLNAVLRRTK